MSDKLDKLSELRIDRNQPLEQKSRWPWLVAAIACLALIAVVFIFLNRETPVQVETEIARSQQNFNSSGSVLDATGYVVARRQATVSSKISGRVQEVLIEEGMLVDEGDIVARLDNTSQQAQLALSVAQEDLAKASLAEIQAKLTQAEAEFRRSTDLASRNLVSQADLEATEAKLLGLRARLSSAEESITVASRSVDLAQDQMENTLIRAPFSGVVVAKNAQPGEMISPVSAGGGFTRTGICTIVDMSSLEIEVDVNEAYIQRVVAGQPVEATLDAYPDWKIPAEVIAIVPTADRQKATVRVRIGFKESDSRVLRDMGVRVAFLEQANTAATEEPNPAIMISQSAIQEDAAGSFVWMIRNDQVFRRDITIDGISNRRARVSTGLSAGDRVVTGSDQALKAGQSVIFE